MRYLDLMRVRTALANGFLASLFATAVWADSRLDDLFAQLQTATDAEAVNITEDIWLEWSKSGSPAMDLLLQRGEAALSAGDLSAAVNHATALIDHDPDFAEGYNLRATAYFQQGQLGLALADIGRVLTLNPRHFGALAGLGAIFEELNEPTKAREVYGEALKINPHMTDVKDAIARIDMQIGGQEL